MQRSETVREIAIRLETKIDGLQESLRELKETHSRISGRIDSLERKVYTFAGLLLGIELSVKLFWSKLIGG